MDKGTHPIAEPGSSSSSAAEALVEELLCDLLDLPAAQRQAALLAMCERFPAYAETLHRRILLLESQLPAAMASGADATFGRFELVQRLGGGMAEVHLAIDTHDGSEVVLKVLRHPELLDKQTQRSFAREAIAASRLPHPGIGAVLETGAVDGTPYLVQPYVPGITLAEWIRRRRERGRGLCAADVDLVLVWLEEILRALHAAHAAGLVHRDVKPSNILLPFQGRPRLLDFGLCLELAPRTAAGTPTPVAGTLAYMAPELLMPRASAPGPAADIYALGVTLFECVALRLPFDADSPQALCRAILLQDPPDPRRLARGLSRGLCRVIACALAKSPGERYPTALAFADDLARLRKGQRLSTLPLRPAPRLRRWFLRHRWTLLPAAVAVVSLLVVVFEAQGLAHAGDPDRELLAIPEQVQAAAERADQLVPGWPHQVGALTEWLQRDGERLAMLLPRLRQRLEQIAADPHADAAVAATLRMAHGQLEAFAVGERSALAAVRERLAWARTVGPTTLDAPAAAWRETIAAIAADPRYGGLRLQPQLDLVPLGRDPKSRLFEFYHPRSGWPGTPPAVRDETGALATHEFSGLVFVLIPPGACQLGEQPHDPTGPRYDPAAAVYAQPFTFEFDAFFVAKFEMTQGQWQRLSGDRPSAFQVGRRYGGDPPITYGHPVESVTAPECDELLRRVGLLLPTEAQWEYAAGAGAPTLWFFGDDPLQLVHYANIDDRQWHAAHQAAPTWLDFDDGFAFTAPVGRFEPNPFGLHDVMGNVAEWCRDECADYAASVPEKGDGMRRPRLAADADRMRHTLRSLRGSRYWQWLNKTSSRPGVLPEHRNDGLGLRPVRALQQEPR